MKQVFFFLAMALTCAFATAQTNQVVWLNGKVLYGHPITTIDSMTYDMNGMMEGDTLHLIMPRSTVYVVHDTVVKTNTMYVRDTIYINKCGSEGQGVFSVSADKQVSFSKGNLQYQASTNTWRFAENQTDYIGNSNSNISATYDGWIDLFGWGTSGFDNTSNDPAAQRYQPWSSATNQVALDSVWNCEMQPITGECQWEYTYSDYNAYGYGPSTNMTDRNLVGTSANYDWGVYNAISNGGSQAGLWRTLTSSEWNYLFNTRKNAEYLWSRGTVNGVYGMILLADDFVKPASVTWTPAASGWTTNVYDAEHWKAMETAGAVFLPAAGSRYGQDVDDVQSYGGYWSGTASNSRSACRLGFDDYRLFPQISNRRDYGDSVRLVQDL